MAIINIIAIPATDTERTNPEAIFRGDAEALTGIETQMDAVAKANAEVNSASRESTKRMSEHSSAVAGDTKTMIEGLQRQLANTKIEFSDLHESFTIASQANLSDTKKTTKEVAILPSGNGGSRWSEVQITSDVQNLLPLNHLNATSD